MSDKYRDEFNKWCKLWDQAQPGMDKEAPIKKANPDTSFFGMNSVNDDDDTYGEIRQTDLNEWRDVIERTKKLYAPVSSLNEAKKKEEKKEPKKKEKTAHPKDTERIGQSEKDDQKGEYNPNPDQYDAKGKDQKIIVTQLGLDGGVLAAIAKLKSMMYDMECEMLTAEAMGGDVGSLQTKLGSLKDQFEKMSELLLAPNDKSRWDKSMKQKSKTF